MADKTAKDRQAKRLVAALRDNLKRRKTQARGRAAEPATDARNQPDAQGETQPAPSSTKD